MITKKMLENANKVTFLMLQYPEHSLVQIISLLQMPAIEINTAIWTAEEMGFIGKPDDETGITPVLSPPEPFAFGDNVKELEDMLVYALGKIAEKEQDIEENYLSNWTSGYSSHDVMIALKDLINDRVVASYIIEDSENDIEEEKANEYTFYTLFKNKDHLWGRKQFKIDPIAEE